MNEVTLADLTVESRDGDWGEAVGSGHSRRFAIIRGTDFGSVALRKADGVPRRYLPDRSSGRRTLVAGDILIETAGGSPQSPTGRTLFISQAILDSFDEPVSCASFARFIRLDPSRAHPAYVQRVLQNLYSRGILEAFQVQHTGVARFQYTMFSTRYGLELPPLRTQYAIAEVLGALDDKIAANTALAGAAEQLLRTEADSAWLQRPEREALLSDFVDLNPPTPKPNESQPLYVDMKKLPEAGWSIDAPDRREAKGGTRFQRGDTLLARITPCLENRKTGYVDNIDDGETAIGSTEFIVLRARDGFVPPIVFLLATEARFREFAIQNMVGTSGRQRVAASDLARFELPIPDERWLVCFGGRARALFEQVESLHKENATLAATRDALLPKLMSGKLRIRDAETAASAAGA